MAQCLMQVSFGLALVLLVQLRRDGEYLDVIPFLRNSWANVSSFKTILSAIPLDTRKFLNLL
jgi:hypothetical protein